MPAHMKANLGPRDRLIVQTEDHGQSMCRMDSAIPGNLPGAVMSIQAGAIADHKRAKNRMVRWQAIFSQSPVAIAERTCRQYHPADLPCPNSSRRSPANASL